MLRGGEVLKQWGFSIMCGSVRGSLWPRQIQQNFHLKHRAATATSLASGGVPAFSPCWLSWGINLAMFTQCSFVWGVGRAKVWWREDPATVLVDLTVICNLTLVLQAFGWPFLLCSTELLWSCILTQKGLANTCRDSPDHMYLFHQNYKNMAAFTWQD